MNDFPRHADDGRAPLEAREHVAQREGSRDRVELVAAFHQPRRGCRIEVGAERDHQNVRLERSRVGHHAPGGRIDGSHRGLQESHARFDDVAVGMAHVGRHLPSEHHVELREAEDERVALVDEHDVDGVAEGIRKNRRQLEAAESRAEHDHACLHRPLPSVCLHRFLRLLQRPGCGTMRMYGLGAFQPFG